MSKKKQTIVLSVIGTATILVLMVGVTFAYFTSTMRGEAANTNVSTKLIGGISFTAQAVDGSEILPGWTSGAKTVTVTAEASDVDMEYSCTLNITENGLSDLKLTLSGDNYVAENNNATLGTTAVTIARGTIPAREEVTSKTMTYTISLPETGENQTEGNSGKNFAATVSCKLDNEIKYYEGSNNIVATNFYDKLLADNPTRLTRTSFDTVFTDTNTGTLYTESGNRTEDVTGDGVGETVYYFAGQAQNNWVKFGKVPSSSCKYKDENVVYMNLSTYELKESYLTEDECKTIQICKMSNPNGLNYIEKNLVYATGLPEEYCNSTALGNYFGEDSTYEYINEYATYTEEVKDIYWRIIRTNEDGGVRLLYVGPLKDTISSYIAVSSYDGEYVGYMYGTSESLESSRTNTNNSVIKGVVDSWYSNVLNANTDGSFTYGAYLSKTAIYCNDRSVSDLGDIEYYASKLRIGADLPSYRCGVDENATLYSTASVADKFSVSKKSGGNGSLINPIALMTADEVSYAGGISLPPNINSMLKTVPWFILNSDGKNILTLFNYWTMSPGMHGHNDGRGTVYEVRADSYLNDISPNNDIAMAVRPVVSLKSCALTTGGNGSSTSPYEISIDAECAAAEN